MDLQNTWKPVSTDGAIVTTRLSVPGGWIVHVKDSSTGSCTDTFVGDPNHEWNPTTD